MNHRASSSILLVATTLMLVVMLLGPNMSLATSEDAIDWICRQMEDYQFCNQTFNNGIKGDDTDNVTLTRFTIVEANRNATNTLGFIRAAIPGEKDPVQLNHYTVCENAYGIVEESFEHALEALNEGDYRGMMAAYERVAPRALASCVTIFEVPPFTQENPLNERNREMRILITMAVVTGSLIVT